MPYTITKVHLFPAVPSGLHVESKIPLAQRSNAQAPGDYHFTPADLIDFLNTNGMVVVENDYADDAAAATGGVAVGEYYSLSLDNIYGLPEGVIKKRIA